MGSMAIFYLIMLVSISRAQVESEEDDLPVTPLEFCIKECGLIDALGNDVVCGQYRGKEGPGSTCHLKCLAKYPESGGKRSKNFFFNRIPL